MVLKRGRKSEKKQCLQLCKSEKNAYGFSVHEISRKRFQKEKKCKKKLTFHIIGCALSKPKFRISHPCWFPRWHKWLKNPPANAGDIRDLGSIPGSGRSPGEGNGNPFKYSCLENPMDRGAWGATVHRVINSRT